MSIDLIKSIYYELLSYFVVQKPKYKIEGKCIQCGKCCSQIRAKGMKNEKDLKIMQFLFPWYKNFYILKIIDEEVILGCKNLLKNGKCKIYNFRPFVCRNYPAKKLHKEAALLESCGYKIVRKKFKDYL